MGKTVQVGAPEGHESLALSGAERIAEVVLLEEWVTEQSASPAEPSDDSREVASSPTVARVEDLPEALAARAAFARGLGSLAIGQTAERAVVDAEADAEAKIRSISDSLDRAAEGDTASLGRNIYFALYEALLSTGLAPDGEITRDANGNLQQDGQLFYDIYANTIQYHPGDHPELHATAYAEGLSLYLMDMLDKAGYFDAGYVWVVPRVLPQNTPGRSVREYGYFENLAVVWQCTWKTGPGRFRSRPLFQAGAVTHEHEEKSDGVMTPAELDELYEQRLSRRHDLHGVAGVYEQLGLKLPGSTQEMLAGFVRHRDDFADPDHPEADIGEMYDDALGPEFFQGCIAPRQDYVAHGERRKAAFAGIADSIPQIIAEVLARRDTLPPDDEIAACRLLAEVVKSHAVDYLIDTPQAREFADYTSIGRASYATLFAYDQMLAMGDIMGARLLRKSIHETARVNMCGHGDSARGGGSSNGESQETYGNGSGSDADGSAEVNIRCDFEVQTCYCCMYDNDGHARRTPLTAKAHRDEEGTLRCDRGGCKAFITKPDALGKTYSFEGFIALKGRRLAEQQTAELAMV